MSGDYSRETFHPKRDFSGVLMQQGRVQLDADWNELIEIIDRRFRAETIDTIGRGTVPNETPHGFEIGIDANNNLTIGCGRIYVDGLLAENHGAPPPVFDPVLAEQRGSDPDRTPPDPNAQHVLYDTQPYFPNAAEAAPAPAEGGPYLVYLDVWRREVTYLEVPDLIEKAVGVDTTTRLQTVWQVRVLADIGQNAVCDTSIQAWDDLIKPSDGRLSTDAVGVASVDDPCVIPPSGGYRGLENRLYRVEIHDGGAEGTATFKWSRDNASIATSVTAIPSLDKLIVARVGRDNTLRFSVGDWIEITDDWLEFAQKPGLMCQIKDVVDATQIITLTSALPAGTFPTDGQGNTDPQRHTRIKRWDSDGLIPVPAQGTSIILEDGVQITFETPANGVYRLADFWNFAARTADASVEKLVKAPPSGIHHHYSRLAVITFPNSVTDCRHLCGPCQAMHITGINWNNDDFLDLDSSYIRGGYGQPGTATFAQGLQITLDTAPDKDSVVPATMIVTMEVPLTFFNRGLPDVSNAPDLSLSFILRGNISVLKSTITWKPTAETVAFIRDILQRLERSKNVPLILARVSLNGSAICSDRGNSRMNLDGQALGAPRALSPPNPRAERIDLIFPSNNCTCASNFQSWFFLGFPSYGYRDGLAVGIGEELI